MNAVDVLRFGHLTLLGTLDGLPEGAWKARGTCGAWSVKDILAHLASYELVLVDILGSVLEQRPTPCLDRFKEQGARFNDLEVEARRGRSVADTLAEVNGAHARTLDLVARIPAETARRPGIFPWYGAAYDLDDLITYMYYGHKREHGAQIDLARNRWEAT